MKQTNKQLSWKLSDNQAASEAVNQPVELTGYQLVVYVSFSRTFFRRGLFFFLYKISERFICVSLVVVFVHKNIFKNLALHELFIFVI